MVLLKSIAGLSLASVASASPYQHQARQNASSPCAVVASSVAAQTVAVPTVSAQLAYDCITSVPFNQSAALALVDGIVPYVRWQSTTAYLKDPPKEYVEKIQDPVDLWGDLEVIREKVVNGSYENEFEVGSHLVYQHEMHSLNCTVWIRALPLLPTDSRRPFYLRTRCRWHGLQLGPQNASCISVF
jgi:hypothetical protein